MILAVSAVFFALGKVRSDIVALCALICLMLFGILTPQEALSGFSNSVVIMMIGLFVVPNGACADDGRQDNGNGRKQRVAPVPARNVSYSRNRGFREQYRHGGLDASHCRKSCGQRQNEREPAAYAFGFCEQHGRHADADRYASQPCYTGNAYREWL